MGELKTHMRIVSNLIRFMMMICVAISVPILFWHGFVPEQYRWLNGDQIGGLVITVMLGAIVVIVQIIGKRNW